MKRLVILAVISLMPVAAQQRVDLLTHRHIIGDIYETVYSIRTGSGDFDNIRLHRVVKEHGGNPLETNKAVMLVHGDVWGFNAAFMPSESPIDSLPVYLAGQGADVWGVDLAWTLVPQSTSDLSFMRRWGLQHDIDDVDTALTIAERLRKDRGNDRGNNRGGFAVLGWSRGTWILYGLLNQETTRPCARRRIKGAIPFDGAFKYTDSDRIAFACAQAESLNASLASGQFGSDFTIWPPLAINAERDPNGPSPILGPPFTNKQALLQIGAAAFALFGPSFAPQYHFVAGVFPNDDWKQIPADLRYTNVSRFSHFVRAASPYMPTRVLRDTFQVSCETESTGPFDDNLGDIQVPILYVGARGGFGSTGLATLDLLGSRSIETLDIALGPQNEPALDFGHVDLLHARNAQSLVWSAIDHWLTVHEDDRVCTGRSVPPPPF